MYATDLRVQGLGTGAREGIVEEVTTELGRDPQRMEGMSCHLAVCPRECRMASRLSQGGQSGDDPIP